MDADTFDRRRLLDEWLSEVLRDYPEQSVPFIAATSDPFRNPVGEMLRRNLAILLDVVRGAGCSIGGNPEGLPYTARRPLEDGAVKAVQEIVRLRAVQDVSGERAVSFLQPLRRMLSDEHAPRIDCLEKLATEMFAECRNRMVSIRAREAQRRTWLLQRISCGARDAADRSRR